jgi:ABC-2 type transport system ATP-binding protein
MAETDPVVSLENVTVAYGANTALREVTAAFARGAVGLLGPNGAGKSTMLKALLGFIVPRGGRMRVLGLDVAASPLEIRARVGYMPESDAHIPGMNAVSFVAYCGELAGLPRVDAMQRAHEVLFYVGLGEARYRNVETYSTGMKQRIKLAQALVHDPDLLFLDEPTNGMDPKGRDEMLELVRDLAHNKGVNLILSSHLLPDVEYTCDDVVVMDKGRIAAQGGIEALKQPRRSSSGCAPPASIAMPPTRTSCASSFRVRVARSSSSRWRPPSACRCGICARASRRSKTSSRTPSERSEGADS